MLQTLSFHEVRKNYDDRIQVGAEMRQLLSAGRFDEFAELALGIRDPKGNYSAAEHGLGPKILSQRSAPVVADLASELMRSTTATAMLERIHLANIPWLKVSVGSEMAMLLRPEQFWVANTRTVWAHLLLKHKFSLKKANNELQLYRSGDQDSEMAYRIWRDLYLEIGSSVIGLAAHGNAEAHAQGIQPGGQPNLWFDSIATYLYEQHGG